MKQIKAAALVLALLLLFVLSACSEKTNNPQEEGTPTPAPTPEITPPAEAEPVVAESFTPPPAPTPITFPVDGYICKEGVNLRSQPFADSDIVDVLGENAPIHIVALEGGWYQLNYNDNTAYVREDLALIGDAPRQHNMYWAKVIVKEAQLYRSNSNLELSERMLKENDVVKVLRTLNGYSHIVCDDYLQRYILATELEKVTDAQALELMEAASADAEAALGGAGQE